MNIEMTLSDADVERIATRTAAILADRLHATINTTSVQVGTQLLTEADAARQLGISPHTLKKWRQQGRVRPATTVRPILYRPTDVEAVAVWLESRSN